MIGKLTGIIDSFSGNQLVIDVHGVGYVVMASARTLRQIGAVGDTASLLIETQVREDAISLFGFCDALERDWFRLLTTVQGVGARVGLAILSSLSPEELSQAIVAQDKTAMNRADGVGPKLALRLVTELKDKAVGVFAPTGAVGGVLSAKQDGVLLPASGTVAEALSALGHLGYRRAEAYAAVTSASQKLGASAALDSLIKASLSELMSIK